MASINYQKICQDLVAQLPAKQREVITRRFGLESGTRAADGEPRPGRAAEGEPRFQRETLESIGQSFGICRERVRQIEKASLSKMKKSSGAYKEAFKEFAKYLKTAGGVKKEETLLNDIGEGKWQAQVYFLLTLWGEFIRVSDGDDFHSLWAQNSASLEVAKNAIKQVEAKLNEQNHPISARELSTVTGLKKPVLESYLETSKRVQKNAEGLYGMREWPEINPKGIKDKIYLLFKKSQKPFHFTDVASRIQGSLVQTVHNELIRDPRFVLIGRGIYALKEWGYVEGDVKDVIGNILTSESHPLTKDEIIEKVLKQRRIKQNTILMNLSNKKYFTKDDQGKYWHAAEGEPRLGRANVQEA